MCESDDDDDDHDNNAHEDSNTKDTDTDHRNVCDSDVDNNEITYFEGCLSFQGKGGVNTKRYDSVIIKTEQAESGWYFSSAPNPTDGQTGWEKRQQNKNDAELRLLETVCVQHEIDHLNGITIMDRQIITTITNKKIGRNEKVTITDGQETKELKWKKAELLVKSGAWKMV